MVRSLKSTPECADVYYGSPLWWCVTWIREAGAIIPSEAECRAVSEQPGHMRWGTSVGTKWCCYSLITVCPVTHLSEQFTSPSLSHKSWLHSLTLNKLLTSSQEPLSVLTIRGSLQLTVSWPDINSQGPLIAPHIPRVLPDHQNVFCGDEMRAIINSLMMWAHIDFLLISHQICSNQPVLMD